MSQQAICAMYMASTERVGIPDAGKIYERKHHHVWVYFFEMGKIQVNKIEIRILRVERPVKSITDH